MEIVEVPVILDSTMFAHESHSRTLGIHVSNIITSIEQDTFGLVKGGDLDSQELEAYRAAGFLFEWGLYGVFLREANVERIGEVELDGIIMTPDAINMDRGRGIEGKCTWRSMAHDVTDQNGEFMSWHMQMKAYGKALGILDWDLWAFFMCGDYRKRRQPKPRHWEITYTKDEVETNWRRITNHLKWMQETGRIL